MSEFIKYGGSPGLPALQVTTGMYPTTGGPLDIRMNIKSLSILDSSEPIGCKLYPGMRIYAEEDKATVTVTGQPYGDGTRWNNYTFSKIVNRFKDAIDSCHDTIYGDKYREVETGNYTIENLMNYLFLRCDGVVADYYDITINYSTDDNTNPPEFIHQQTKVFSDGSSFSITPYELTGYTPSPSQITGVVNGSDLTYNVVYTHNKYILYYKDSDSHIYDTQTYYYGDTVVLPEAPVDPTGRTFIGWVFNPGLGTGNKMPASNVYALAQWQPLSPTYNISVNVSPSSGYGQVTGGGTYDSGETYTLTATANYGYDFVNWTENGNVIGTQTTFTGTATGNRTITCNFIAKQYNVNASVTPSGAGTVTGTGPKAYDSTCTLSAVPSSGHFRFLEYTGTSTYFTPQITFRVLGDTEFVAHFERLAQVSLDIQTAGPQDVQSKDGGTVEMSQYVPSGQGGTPVPGYYPIGEEVTLTATTNTGFQFVGFFDENGDQIQENPGGGHAITITITEGSEVGVPEDREITVKWVSVCEVTVATDPEGAGTPTVNGHEYDYNAQWTDGLEFQLAVTSDNPSLEFKGWDISGYQTLQTPASCTFSPKRRVTKAVAKYTAAPAYIYAATLETSVSDMSNEDYNILTVEDMKDFDWSDTSKANIHKATVDVTQTSKIYTVDVQKFNQDTGFVSLVVAIPYGFTYGDPNTCVDLGGIDVSGPEGNKAFFRAEGAGEGLSNLETMIYADSVTGDKILAAIYDGSVLIGGKPYTLVEIGIPLYQSGAHLPVVFGDTTSLDKWPEKEEMVEIDIRPNS